MIVLSDRRMRRNVTATSMTCMYDSLLSSVCMDKWHVDGNSATDASLHTSDHRRCRAFENLSDGAE